MSLPRYPAYKDSGVSWLGEVPAHWEHLTLSRVLECPVTDGPHSTPVFVENGIPFLSVDGIQDGELNFDRCRFISHEDHAEFSKKALPLRDDILMGKAASVGKIARVKTNYQFNIWSPLALIRADKSLCNPVFLEFSLKSKFVQAQIETLANSNTQMNIGMKDIPRIRLALPPLNEQIIIAKFLDHETTKIDALIAEQKKLIALLGEKRLATISRAVTRGLDPNVSLKDSGVPWLGKVPAHWEVVPLKYLVTLRSGGTPSKENLEYWDGEVPWASAKDMKLEELYDTEDHITEKALTVGAANMVPVGSVLVVVRGMILARLFPVCQVMTPMAINQDLKAVLPGERLAVNFLPWLLRGSAEESLRRLDEAGHGTKALRMDAWTSMLLPLPPLEEQSEIAVKLCHKLKLLATLSEEAVNSVNLLKERRAALISAAVTGKIDVRGLTA